MEINSVNARAGKLCTVMVESVSMLHETATVSVTAVEPVPVLPVFFKKISLPTWVPWMVRNAVRICSGVRGL